MTEVKTVKSNRHQSHYAPVQRQTPPARRKKPLGPAVIVSLVIVGILLVVAIAGGTYINHLLNLVDRNPVTGDPNLHESDLVDPYETFDEPDNSEAISDAVDEYKEVGKIDIPQSRDVYNILLIGADRRDGESRGRSDAMLILSINQKTETIHLTSLMRAMYVAIPGKDWSMLNHSYAWGGPDLLLKTIENNFRIQIDDYMIIDFSGFTQAIDRVGGISIDLTAAEATYINYELGTTRFVAGNNTLDGAAALSYARIRKLDSDFKRTGRQRVVIEALLQKSRSLNAIQLTGLAQDLLPLVSTNLSQGEMLQMVSDMLYARNFPVKQLMLPLEEHREMIYVRKMEMYRIDFTKTVQTLHSFIYGE